MAENQIKHPLNSAKRVKFGGLYINPRQNKTTIVTVLLDLKDRIIVERAWRQWNHTNQKKICVDLGHCRIFKKCHSIMYDRYRIPTSFQDRLDKLPYLQQFAVSHELNTEIIDTVRDWADTNTILLNPDGQTKPNVAKMQCHQQDNNRKIVFFLSQLEHDYVVAFSYAVYLAVTHYQSVQ